MKSKRLIELVSAIAVFAISMPMAREARAQANACMPDDGVLEAHRYLRAMSLDLRGELPSDDELAALDAAADPLTRARELEREWLMSDAFAERVVRRHHDLLWNNLGNQGLVGNQQGIAPTRVPLEDGTTATKLIYTRPANNRSLLYRGIMVGGALPVITKQIPCLAIPQATLNAMTDAQIKAKWGTTVTYGERNGIRYIDLRNPLSATDTNVDTLYHREGYVDVHPFWAPATTISICAFDGQEREVSVDGVTRCDDTFLIGNDLSCGCGPSLRHCGVGEVTTTLLKSFAKAVDLQVRDAVQGGGNYYDGLFLSSKTYVNGPMAFFYTYLNTVYRQLDLAPAPVPNLPSDLIDFTKVDDWRAIEVGPHAAGVLTSPGFLLRFQTNRARANRFFDKFLCLPLQAPAQGLPAPDDPCSAEPDLQKRCGCGYCHIVLEPAAAHWGRWSESGAAYLSAAEYPKDRTDCTACAASGNPASCSLECRQRYHITPQMAGDPYLGVFRPYVFLKEQHFANVENGPRLLVLSSMVDGSLQDCTVRQAFEWLVGRAPESNDEEAWVAQLGDDFAAANYDYGELIRAIVESDNYRRVP
ncbi:MAG: hypothetical protein ACAI38_12595 [Myxococcota bacterium]